MNRDRRSSSNDPTAERAVDQSTQSASGLSSGNRTLDTDRDRLSDSPDDEVVNRLRRCTTPRRYEQPIEDDDDPCLPANRP